MEYNFRAIESRWQNYWREHQLYKVKEDASRPPFYVLDMFPYPSGAGLHVGHPLGYIASDIFARYKRLKGFSVLHPMGYDAFGLPAEQYAIETGQHPATTTAINLERYREQLDRIGFSFDWSREVRTSDPAYYKWTQWVFIRLFSHYFDTKAQAAKPIDALKAYFAEFGSHNVPAYSSEAYHFSAQEWAEMSHAEQEDVLMSYRLAYRKHLTVNWCPILGTVLANDEISEGVSIRGGYPVEQRLMLQWCLRISAYAERLLSGLDELDWSDRVKTIQRNWIGKSTGAEVRFAIDGGGELVVFTTRPDTLYGVTFMVLAPESEYVDECTTPAERERVHAYVEQSKRRTERERMIDRSVSGVFTGSYAINPLSGERIPVWVSDYVLSGYGTGAVMAVPAHDSRDFAFAQHFDLPIRQVVLLDGEEETDPKTWTESKDSKSGRLIASGDFDGLKVKDAQKRIVEVLAERGLGSRKVNYRLRDAIFSRQRYWGEPIPIYYKDGIAYPLSDEELPLVLPEVDKYLPTETGEPPLGRAKDWCTKEGYPYELSTMPGFAGSSAYYLRYMDPHNAEALVGKEANEYWKQVDLYVGGIEHATGHLIYSRFWNKFLYDLGLIVRDEPFRKMINQGMIQGKSRFVYRLKDTNTFVSHGLKDQYETTEIHVDVNLVDGLELSLEGFRNWRDEYKSAEFILEDGRYICGEAVEKMSKSLYNVVNPDDLIERYGADSLRLYEMFLGPIEQSKPWDTKGIDGVFRFLKKLWVLFYGADGSLLTSHAPASRDELRSLHKLIKKVSSDIEAFSFNTSISAFMVCVSELQGMNTNSLEVLRPLLILLSPFAPHICEELWHATAEGEVESILLAQWPELNEALLVEDNVTYAVSFNGKTRFTISLPATLSAKEVEQATLSSVEAEKWLEGKSPKKVIVVLGRIVNVVL